MADNIHPLLRGLMRRRAGGLGALPGGDTADQYPAPDGSPGSFVYPYGERKPVLGEGADGGVSAPPILGLPGVGSSAPAGGATGGISTPYGESGLPWSNPTTFQLVPILATTPANIPVLSLNLKRNMLLIQNNSSASGTGNTAPTFYIAFNAQAQVGVSLALLPGGNGILFDIICPRDSVYLTIAGGAGTYTVSGCVGQGTYSPPS